MSRIETLLYNIEHAVKGEEVRGSIHDAVEQCYNDVHNPTLNTEALEAAIQAEIAAGHMAALTIGDGTITAAKLSSNPAAVTTAKIADGAITQAKLDPNIDFVQVDETLTHEGEAADAAAVGEALSELNGRLENIITIMSGLYTFSQGGISPSDGSNVNTNNGIRTGFIPENKAITALSCPSDYCFRVWAWNKSSGAYVGALQADGTTITTGTLPLFTYLKLPWDAGYKYKITMHNRVTSVAIQPSAGSNMRSEFNLINELTGDTYNTVSLPQYVQGGIRPSTGELITSANTIRSDDYITKSSGIFKIKSAEGYCFRILAWDDSGEFVGALRGDGTYSADSPFAMLTDITIPRGDTYKYKICVYVDNPPSYTSPILPAAGSNIVATRLVEHELVTDLLESIGIDTEPSVARYSSNPAFVGNPITIFDNQGEDAIEDIDDGLLNFVNVIKISDEMYYMYYESIGANESGHGYDTHRSCFAYSTDGEHFVKGFPSGITPPIPGTNEIMQKGSVNGKCVVKVPDPEYPFRMVGTIGTNPNRIANIWKSADGVNWNLIRQIGAGYHDSASAVVVRGNSLKIFLRTRNDFGRIVGVITTDLDGNRLMSNWTTQISLDDYNKQLYTSGACALDDRREILFPTVYDPDTSEETVTGIILDGSNAKVIENMDMSSILPSDVKSIYIGPGLVNIGLKTYLFYTTRDTDHEHLTPETNSKIMRVEVTDTTFGNYVHP